MANFPYVRAPGTWINGTDVDPSEWEAINLYLFKSPNFADGGAYAPTSEIIIGGAGVIIDSGAVLLVGGTARIEDGGTFDMDPGSIGNVDADEFNFGGACAVGFQGGPVTFGATCDPVVQSGCAFTFLSGSTLIGATGSFAVLGGANTVTGSLLVIGATTWVGSSDPVVQSGCAWTWQSGSQQTWQSGSEIVFDSGSLVSGTLALSANTTQTGRITKSGAGARTVERLANCTTNADNIITTNADVYFYTQTTSTARVLRLRDASAPTPVEGEVLTIHIDMSTPSSTDQVSIENETSGDQLVAFQRGTPGTSHHYLTAVFRSGTWRATMYQGNVTSVGAAA